jgi:TPR repeat protein
MSNTNRSRSAEPRTVQKAAAIHKATPSIRTHNTDSTDRTVKPSVPLHERSPSAELTAEEHLEIGIQSHSNGELNKSTYHLRIAAREGSPTGMLLYALACRHGWGMRPNQEEGVRWLKNAIDSAGLEVADVEQTLSAATKSKGDPHTDALERKKRKAQFALAIYELGISYMNGWGCPKDKPLAVRCFEVAGSWGDCDAQAEAGYCYTQGVGCKKDLRKAAALYRQAADGGMSMAGNSW